MTVSATIRDLLRGNRGWYAVRSALGFYQLAGGLVGSAMVARAWPAVMLVSAPDARGQTILALGASLLFFACVAVAGVLTARAIRGWVLVSGFAQSLQLVWFAGAAGSYYFAAGVVAGAAFRGGHSVLVLKLDFTIIASIEPATLPAVVGVNLAAAVVMLLVVVTGRRTPDAVPRAAPSGTTRIDDRR